ncbi:MAG: T9SS C-terminal target domain-containing protein [Balneola sp.]|nr:MAG: T9SS C-terminal target domain-containing protein [Balneola sp.]
MKRRIFAALFVVIVSIDVHAQTPIAFNTITVDGELPDEKSKASTPVTFISINEEIFSEENLKVGTQLQVNTHTQQSVVTINRVSEYMPGLISVSATSENDPGNVFSFTYKEGRLIGLLHESLGDNTHFDYSSKQKSNYFTKAEPEAYVCTVDHDEFGNHYNGQETLEKKNKAQSDVVNFVAGTTGSSTTIDVMIVYTANAEVAAFLESEGIEFVIAQSMNLSQTALDNSGIPITLRLVHTYKTEENVTQSSGDQLRLLTASPTFNPFGIQDGILDEVHTLRDQYGADLVTLYADVSDTGGIAWVGTNRNGSPDFGFSLNRVRQAHNSYTVVHELGHNMGNFHSRTQAVQTAPVTGGVFQESVGYQDLVDSVATVMAYTTGGLTRIPYFSSSTRSVGTTPLGINSTVLITDASLSLKRIKNAIASYRKTTIDAPTSSVSTNSIEVNLSPEETANISVTIENTGASLLEYDVDFEMGRNILSKQALSTSSNVPSAANTRLFGTGFESGVGFFLSSFEAISSWRTFGGTDITISNEFASQADQHLRLLSTGTGGSKTIFGPFLGSLPFASYRTTFDIKVSSSEQTNNETFDIIFLDGKDQESSSGIRIIGGEIYVLGKNELGQDLYQSSGIMASSDNYNEIEIDVNTFENEINYYIDSVLVAEIPISNFGITPAEIIIASTNLNNGTFLDFDNFKVFRYENPYPWLTVNTNTNTVTEGNSKDIVFTFSSVGVENGTYTTTALINTNEGGVPVYEIPITLNISGVVSNESDPERAEEFQLLQNYPNPFNPSTTISFSLPQSGDVSLKVYNAIGMEMGTLVDEFYSAGQHRVQFDASSLASGIYIYSLEFGGVKQTRKMLLLK